MSNSYELNNMDDSQNSAITNTSINNVIDDANTTNTTGTNDEESFPPLVAPSLMRTISVSVPQMPPSINIPPSPVLGTPVLGSPNSSLNGNGFPLPVLLRQTNNPIDQVVFDELLDVNGLPPNPPVLGNIVPFPQFPQFPQFAQFDQFPQLPPMQPLGLQRTASVADPDFDRYVQETYDTYDMYNAHNTPVYSKLQLIKGPIITFLGALKMVSPKSIVSLIAYDDQTKVYNGSIDEIIDHVNALRTRGSTDFVQMINRLKEELANSNPEFEKFIFGLTDGMHNVGRSVQEILNDESTYNIFNMTLGIGSQHDVQHDLLKHLTGNSDDKYHLSKNAVEIEDIINGGCFEGVLAKNIHQATFELLFENSSDVCVLGEESRSEMTKQEYQTYIVGKELVSDVSLHDFLNEINENEIKNYLQKVCKDYNLQYSEPKILCRPNIC